ncbi:MAG: hypothetical protein ACJ70T_04450 [Nitrososphaera sp.]
MTDINNQIIIYCPYCKMPITGDELHEYVNANPQIKKQAIEEELELWGEVYDRNYLVTPYRHVTLGNDTILYVNSVGYWV